jgi:hypothetical protein
MNIIKKNVNLYEIHHSAERVTPNFLYGCNLPVEHFFERRF